MESYSFKRACVVVGGRGLVRLSLKNIFMDKKYVNTKRIWLETHCPGIFVTPSPAWCSNFSHHGKKVIHCSND